MLDSLDMFGATARFPEQVAEAAKAAAGVEGLPPADEIDNVVVLGMGGSGIAGDVLAAIGGPFVPVPIVGGQGLRAAVVRGPGHAVLRGVVLGQHRRDARSRPGRGRGRGPHGRRHLGRASSAALAPSWQAPHVPLPDDIPQPRAGLGALAVPLILLLEQVGLFPGRPAWVDAAVEPARGPARRRCVAGDAGPADRPHDRPHDPAGLRRRPARQRGRGAGGRPRSTRTPRPRPSRATFPELCHNEIVGWGQHGDVTRQVFTLVELRHDEEHPQELRRFELVRDLMAEVVHDVIEVRAVGEGAAGPAVRPHAGGRPRVAAHGGAGGHRPGPDPGPRRPEAGAGRSLTTPCAGGGDEPAARHHHPRRTQCRRLPPGADPALRSTVRPTARIRTSSEGKAGAARRRGTASRLLWRRVPRPPGGCRRSSARRRGLRARPAPRTSPRRALCRCAFERPSAQLRPGGELGAATAGKGAASTPISPIRAP